MKAKEIKLLNFLKLSPQFVIPVYQRTYSWTERECRQLWDDILRTGNDDQIDAHFVGSIVYIEESVFHVAMQPPLLVIDGQQRLTTTMLILEALARHLGDEEPVDGFTARKLREYYLLNPLEENDRRFKLVLTQTDKASLHALVEQKPLPQEESMRVAENFEFFEKQIVALGGEVAPLCRGLAKLMIVDIALSRDQDNPQLIFESMNSTGRELSQADLIRNFVLMGLEPAQQTRLYKDQWRPMELAFGQEAYGTHFDGFMRHYLTFETGEIPKLGNVYDAFKAHAREPQIEQGGIEALVADIRTGPRFPPVPLFGLLVFYSGHDNNSGEWGCWKSQPGGLAASSLLATLTGWGPPFGEAPSHSSTRLLPNGDMPSRHGGITTMLRARDGANSGPSRKTPKNRHKRPI